MSQRSIILCKCLSMGMGAFLIVGCRPQLEPDEDAILHYFRNARVHGDVRRVWPEGQQYVDAVLKADAELQKELAPLRELQLPQSLWSREDPRWRDPEQVGKHVLDLLKLLDGRSPDRRILLHELGEAVDKVPPTLTMSGDAEAAFLARVRKGLTANEAALPSVFREGMLSLERSLRSRLELFRTAQGGAGDFDPDARGLKVLDPTRQAQIDGLYDELSTSLDRHREAFLVYAEAELIASAEKGKIKERNEREYQTNLRAYLRKALAAVPKALQNLKQRTEQEAREEASSATRAFLERRIEQLEDKRKKMKARVDEILDRAKKAAERATENRRLTTDN